MIASVLQVWATDVNNASGLRIFEFVGETGEAGDYPGAWLVDRMQHLLLPTIVLILLNAAFFSRIQRNLMLDSLGSDFVRTARAKGLRRSRAVMKHALRTVADPDRHLLRLQRRHPVHRRHLHGDHLLLPRHG